MMLRALESPDRAHTLLTGPPASAKSLFMLQIEKYMSARVYFAEGASQVIFYFNIEEIKLMDFW
jgi:hypothetical protein